MTVLLGDLRGVYIGAGGEELLIPGLSGRMAGKVFQVQKQSWPSAVF